MEVFNEVVPGIKILKTPFGKSWSGVALVDTSEGFVLIDSGADANVVDDCIIPALKKENLSFADISWLLNTHSHGDHIGGHKRIKELSAILSATYKDAADKSRNPLKYGKIIRLRFPEYSPPPQTVLEGIEPDKLIGDGEKICGSLSLIHAPGHDDDTVCWFDEKTKTLITGDSLQCSGSENQGIAFYQYVNSYRSTLAKLMDMDIDNIVAGHDYTPFGSLAIGKRAVKEYLQCCVDMSDQYDELIKEIWDQGERDPAEITRYLITKNNRQVPKFIFLALHTVTTHIRNLFGE